MRNSVPHRVAVHFALLLRSIRSHEGETASALSRLPNRFSSRTRACPLTHERRKSLRSARLFVSTVVSSRAVVRVRRERRSLRRRRLPTLFARKTTRPVSTKFSRESVRVFIARKQFAATEIEANETITCRGCAMASSAQATCKCKDSHCLNTAVAHL